MRLGTLSTLLIVALSLSACGGESVEDRARALKAAQKPPPGPASPLENGPAPNPNLDTPPPRPTASSSAGVVPVPDPQKP